MKKLLVLLVVALTVLAFTSCGGNNVCTCKAYDKGEVVSTTQIDLDNSSFYEECSDMNTFSEHSDGKYGTECL